MSFLLSETFFKIFNFFSQMDVIVCCFLLSETNESILINYFVGRRRKLNMLLLYSAIFSYNLQNQLLIGLEIIWKVYLQSINVKIYKTARIWKNICYSNISLQSYSLRPMIFNTTKQVKKSSMNHLCWVSNILVNLENHLNGQQLEVLWNINGKLFLCFPQKKLRKYNQQFKLLFVKLSSAHQTKYLPVGNQIYFS